MGGVMRKAMIYLGLSDDDYQVYAPKSEAESQPTPIGGASYSRGTASILPIPSIDDDSDDVVSLADDNLSESSSEPKVKVPKCVVPSDFTDAKEVGDYLKNDTPVVLDLNAAEVQVARRLVDFCSGSTYVVSGTMEKIAKNKFLLLPDGVTVADSEKERYAD